MNKTPIQKAKGDLAHLIHQMIIVKGFLFKNSYNDENERSNLIDDMDLIIEHTILLQDLEDNQILGLNGSVNIYINHYRDIINFLEYKDKEIIGGF